MSPNAKASYYLQQLDDARCKGAWHAVPELVRKIRKHAPDRECLSITAETDCVLSQATQSSLASSSSPPDADLSSWLVKLLNVVTDEKGNPEDRFQGQICLAWLHWVLGEYNTAVARLPHLNEQVVPGVDPADLAAEWTNVCILRAVYLRANCLVRDERHLDALTAFEAGLPSLAGIWAGHPPRSQLRYWAEQILSEFCMLAAGCLRDGRKSLHDANSLVAFRIWARYWAAVSPTDKGPPARDFPGARDIWNQYYRALSLILELDLPLPLGAIGKIEAEASARSQLRAELKEAEAAIEGLLLEETIFPRADGDAKDVEEFVSAVTRNWAILCGRNWRQTDLGAGGRMALSKHVLDLLYRVATKTYHSTAILRHLFRVHLTVADFDLAFKAFDAWLGIIKNGKARVDKTGHVEPSLDDDATVLETMSECVAALCRYPDQQAAERARDLGAELEDLMARLPQLRQRVATDSVVVSGDDELSAVMHPPIPPGVVALAWQAIGLAQAHWAALTREAGSRAEIQSKAIRCLRKSLSPEYGRTRDPRTLFALGVLLTERREVAAAIDVVRSALMSVRPPHDQAATVFQGPFHWERALVPLWHLLALLLSARQEYVKASRACEGALEQFRDPTVLFGGADLIFRSEHLNDLAAVDDPAVGHRRVGLVDEMDDAERLRLLEVKMTQLRLVELLEGPDVAVNASYELLALFNRLFGSVQPHAESKPADDFPKSSAGTVKSIRGTVFGGTRRHFSLRTAMASRQAISAASTTPTIPTVPNVPVVTAKPETASISSAADSTLHRQTTWASANAPAPLIQITQEIGLRPLSRRSSSLSGRRSESGQRNSLRKRGRSDGRSGSRRRAASSGGIPRSVTSAVNEKDFFTPDPDQSAGAGDPFPLPGPGTWRASSSRKSSFSKPRSLHQPESARSAEHTLDPHATGMPTVANSGDPAGVMLKPSGAPLPAGVLPEETARRSRTTRLVEVWLMIGGFYRRAGMLDDCRGAVGEAQRLVGTLEAEEDKEIARDAGAMGAAGRGGGWAGGKNLDELWGDVWTELGALSLARDARFDAQAEFEAALMHCPDHPGAIVGLSNILLDVYGGELLPQPAVPKLSSTGDDGTGGTKSHKQEASQIPSGALGLGLGGGKKAESRGRHMGAPSRTPKPAPASFSAKRPLSRQSTSPTLSSVRPSSARTNTPPVPPIPAVHRNAGTNGIVGTVGIMGSAGTTTDTAAALLSAEAAGIDELPAPYKAMTLPLVDRLAARDRAHTLLSGLTRLGTGWNLAEAWFALARAEEASGRGERAKEILWWCVELEEGKGVRGWGCAGGEGYIV